MKNILFAGCCLFAMQTMAQTGMTKEAMFPRAATYSIKGGNTLPYDKIDSVLMAWGGRFSMEHIGDDKIVLAPMDAGDLKKQDDYKAALNALVGQVAKDFSLKDPDGKSYSLAGMKGNVVVLNFWFTSCAGCVEEMPELNKLQKEYAGKNVIFLALALDNSGQVKRFREKQEFDYTLLTDAGVVHADYHVSMCPVSMVIDKSGVIRWVQVGGRDIGKVLDAAIGAVSQL